jgi:hypothetical protein
MKSLHDRPAVNGQTLGNGSVAGRAGQPVVRVAPSPNPNPSPNFKNSTVKGTTARASGADDDPRRPIDPSRAAMSHANLARWLLERETVAEADDPVVAAERVCQKLSPCVSRLVSPTGFQAILSRALHLAAANFPFLVGVRAGMAPAMWLKGLDEHVQDIDAGEAVNAVLAVLGALLDLLVRFIGEDLTLRLVQEAWPELPSRESTRPESSNGREAALPAAIRLRPSPRPGLAAASTTRT